MAAQYRFLADYKESTTTLVKNRMLQRPLERNVRSQSSVCFSFLSSDINFVKKSAKNDRKFNAIKTDFRGEKKTNE